MQDAVTQGRESSSPPSTDLVTREANLTNRIELLDIGLRVHGELNWAEFEDAASSLQRVGRAWQFWIGDILCYGERRFGERYAQVLDAADRWGMKIETLRTAQWVSEKIPLVERSTSLSWYHHKLVAGLETEERRALLAKAEEAGSSTRELQDAVQTFKRQLKSGGTATSDSATTASSFPTLDPEAGAEDEMDSR